jgi:hypothetical protein
MQGHLAVLEGLVHLVSLIDFDFVQTFFDAKNFEGPTKIEKGEGKDTKYIKGGLAPVHRTFPFLK